MNVLYKGVDISKHNSINWNRVRKAEVDFVNKFGGKKYQWKVVENDNGHVVLSRGEMKEDDVENG